MNFCRCYLERPYELAFNSQGAICTDKGLKYVVLMSSAYLPKILLIAFLFFNAHSSKWGGVQQMMEVSRGNKQLTHSGNV